MGMCHHISGNNKNAARTTAKMSLLCPQKLAKVNLVTSECFESRDMFGHGRFQRWFFPLATWDYDPEQDRRSIVSRWDLVCHRRPLLALAHAVYIAGSLIFMSFVGLIVDRVGRLSMLLSTVAALQLATLGGCFSATYHVYILSRFLDSGCAATGTVLSSTLLFEASTHTRRSLHLYTAMAVGMLTAEGWFAVGRLLRHHDWITMQSFILSPTVLTLYAFIVAHESPR
ncbi:organic anion transporter 3-like [Amblyomma americanum]